SILARPFPWVKTSFYFLHENRVKRDVLAVGRKNSVAVGGEGRECRLAAEDAGTMAIPTN
ncbi:MAG: hypothetical protein KDA61_16605, partial [Planctomycetales bacterium]|nr:hypothetical protein [Planctomycetales bacterium]